MKRKFLLSLIIYMFGLVCLFPLFAGEKNIEFNIRFYEKRVYYVDTDPIYIQVTINNNSPQTYRFKLADERAFSVDFDARTMTNRKLSEADILTRKRTEDIKIFFREIAIEPGESFSFVEDLRDYVKFNSIGSFRVKAIIYPELYRASYSVLNVSSSIESNYLSLTLRPTVVRGQDGIPLELDTVTGAVLTRQNLPPDEVVSYMIKARQESQWEKFFLYLDLDAMLLRDPVQKQKWMAENEPGRIRLASEYRQNLQKSVIDSDISLIPTSFEIERTLYNNSEGTVTLLAKFRNVSYTELRRYVYSLERRENIWFIVDYSVQSMGTQAND